MANQSKVYGRRLVRIPVVNTRAITTTDITGSLQGITEPTKSISSVQRQAPSFPKIVSNSVSQNFNQKVLLYSARAVEKQITSYDSGSNSLIIGSSELDYSIDTPKKEEFEVYYNGLRIMPIFIQSITQEGSDVVIVLTQDIINYTSLQLQEVIVIGKFK